MKKLLHIGFSGLFILSLFFSCKPEDNPIQPDQPHTVTLLSTQEAVYPWYNYLTGNHDTITFVEARYSDSTRMYFRLLSQSTAEVVNYRGFYPPAQESQGWIYRGDVEIPETFTHRGDTYSVVSIGESAFGSGSWGLDGYYDYAASLVTSVKIPSSVTNIGYRSFCGCKSLNSVEILGPVTMINRDAFNSCINLETITLPSTVTALASGAFEECSSMTEFTIPKWVSEMGSSVFGFDTTPLKTLTCLPLEPPVKAVWDSYGEEFFLPESLETIYVPASSVAAYKTSQYWGQFASIIVGQ